MGSVRATSCAGRGPRTREVDACIASALALGAAAVFSWARQDPYWSDGRALVDSLSGGGWVHHHVLYLPLAHAVRWLTGPIVDVAPRATLELISAVASGIAVALVFAAGRCSGLGRRGSILAALLLATTPTVTFFATCVEVHAVQLSAAAAACLWCVRRGRAGTDRQDGLRAALLFCLLLGTHLSAVLCAPALGLLISSKTWSAGPRRAIHGLLVIAAFAGLWSLVNSGNEAGFSIARDALGAIASDWDPLFAWREVALPAGSLYPLAFVALVSQWLVDPAPLRGLMPRTLAVLLLAFVPFAMAFHVAERGAYYSWALPGLALCAGRWLEGARWRQLLGLGLLVLHALWAREELRGWSEEYPGHEWIPTLEAEIGEDGLVIALDFAEFTALRNHSRTLALYPGGRVNTDPLGWAHDVARVVERALGRGRVVGMTRASLENDHPASIWLVEALVRRHGSPRSGLHPAYVCWRGDRTPGPVGLEPLASGDR